jgi:hypothetical protein
MALTEETQDEKASALTVATRAYTTAAELGDPGVRDEAASKRFEIACELRALGEKQECMDAYETAARLTSDSGVRDDIAEFL